MKKGKDGKIRYRINEFSNMTGFSPAVIRYYETQGYPFPRREENGYRTFQVEDAYRINMFRSIRARGFSINESIALLQNEPREVLRQKLEQNRERMDREIFRMQKRRAWVTESIRLLELRSKKPQAVWMEQWEDIWVLPASLKGDFTIAQKNAQLRPHWDDHVGVTRYVGFCDGKRFASGKPSGCDVGIAATIADLDYCGIPRDETVFRMELGECVCFFVGDGDQEYLRLECHPEVKRYLEENKLKVRGDIVIFYLMLYLEEDGEDLAVAVLPVTGQ